MRTIAASTATLVRLGEAATVRTMSPGHEQLQSEQDGLGQLLAEAPADITVAPREPDGAGHERDRCAGRGYYDPAASMVVPFFSITSL